MPATRQSLLFGRFSTVSSCPTHRPSVWTWSEEQRKATLIKPGARVKSSWSGLGGVIHTCLSQQDVPHASRT